MIPTAAIAIKAILVISFLSTAVYFVGTGIMFSCGGFIGWILVSVLVAVILSVLLLPLILLAGLVASMFGI